jgi:tetratricopeptide (TPR) repeat protein
LKFYDKFPQDSSNEVNVGRANLYYLSKQFEEAGKAYLLVLMNDPDFENALEGAAWAHYRLGMKVEANKLCQRLLIRHPNNMYGLLLETLLWEKQQDR